MYRVRISIEPNTGIDFVQAKHFLVMVDPHEKKWVFQTFDDHKTRRDKKLTKILIGSLAEHHDELARLNEQGAGIFVTLNSTDGRGRKEENITGVRAVSLDLDGEPIDPVRKFKLKPHLEIESSPSRYHAYWLADSLDPKDYKGVQHAIAERFDGDPSVAKLTHVARLPGFFHNKAEPFRTRILKERAVARYTAEQIESAFPPQDEPHKPPKSRPLLDADVPIKIAQEFIKRLYLPDGHKPGVFGLLHYRGRYYKWKGTHYELVDDAYIRKQLYLFLHLAMARKKDGFVPFNANRTKVGLVEHALAHGIHLESKSNPPFWIISEDDEPVEERGIIACENGLVHIDTRIVKPHRPDFFNVNSLPFEYDPDAPMPARWLKFLREIWPDDKEARRTLQEIFGLLLTTDTSYQKIFLLVGPKRSGKGTIARVMDALFGENNVVHPTIASIGGQFGLATLIDKSIAIISDARVGRADSNVLAERLLSISGEDNQSIEIKYEKSWSGKLYTRFVIMTNELPRINDASGALTSRIVLLSMRQSFYNRENLDLTNELLEELPGIFNWSLSGLARLRERRRFITPQSSKQAIELLEDLASPVGAFVRKWCVTGPDEYEKVHVLYDAYCKWCELEGHKPSSDAMFGRHLRGFLSTIIWKGRGRDRKYVGISLSQDGFDQYESIGRRD